MTFNTVMQNFSSNTAAAFGRGCSRIDEAFTENGLFAADIAGSTGKDQAAPDSSFELDVLCGKLRLDILHSGPLQFLLLRRVELSWHRAS